MADDLTAEELGTRAAAIIHAHLRGDVEACRVLVGTDAAALLPVLTAMLADTLAGLIGHDRLAADIADWLDQRAARLTG